ncbi:MAG TPA: DUF5985 family protein [Novosphingobium sp.]|jgi:hypothetical protein|nr:DUF5985 family protein [Novosphingobium sp.]
MTEVLPAAVYLLCFLTSTACAVLLARSYARTRLRLLLWSAICFGLLAGNNLTLVVDLLLLPQVDLRLLRHLFALAAIAVLLFGFVWERDD